MTDFPTHMYRVPGPFRKAGGQTYSLKGAADQEQFDELLAQGWFASIEDAVAAKSADKAVKAARGLDEAIDNISGPSREELETKAAELEIKFDGRTSDKTLADRIARKLAEDDEG